MSIFLHFLETKKNFVVELNKIMDYQSIGKTNLFTYKILHNDKIDVIINYLHFMSGSNGLVFTKDFELERIKVFLSVIGTDINESPDSSSSSSSTTTRVNNFRDPQESLNSFREFIKNTYKRTREDLEEDIEEDNDPFPISTSEIAPSKRYVRIDFENYLNNRQFVKCKDCPNTDVGIYFSHCKQIMFDKNYYSPREFVRKVIKNNTGDNTYVSNEEACYKLEKRIKNGEWVPLMSNYENGEWIEIKH